eukprot:CAMPEP_0197439572 /NCGR_PEP_ID=MMETSP1175-20131217/6278_1 /TAXON_ID=1003142 /ORGANISM="Triceratium dubium, Strain CCMP147" /LENGTH=635 /DNA_ID=CAMNT_0042969503 /DNA_START=289 /DNA_END=2197 /DNA_ORIENTATION=-
MRKARLNLIFLPALVSAAERLHLDERFLRGEFEPSGRRDLLLSDVADRLNLGRFAGLREVKAIEGLDGDSVTTRYQQTWHGIPVWGEHIIVTTGGTGTIRRLGGTAVTGIHAEDFGDNRDLFMSAGAESFGTDGLISAGDALDAMKLHASLGYAEGASIQYSNEQSEMVVYAAKNTLTIAYAVNFFVDLNEGGQPSRPHYLVDARNSSILLQYDNLSATSATRINTNNTDIIRHNPLHFSRKPTNNNIGGRGMIEEHHRLLTTCTDPEEGTGPGGNEKTGKYEYGFDSPSLYVTCVGNVYTMENPWVRSVNLNQSTSGSTTYSYASPRNTFKAINGAYSPINDAHHFGTLVNDMYDAWFANSMPQLVMRVHYSNDFEGIFWDGNSVTCGDGKDTFYPLVSLDMVSRMVAQGFTEMNSGLVNIGQSGGIREAFSDIAGEAAEYYLYADNDWLVGAEIVKEANGFIRSLANPTSDGESIDSALNYQDGMDTQLSAGVFNKAFYLLATTPGGWNTRRAFDVFYYANEEHWSPHSNFIQGRDGCISAAEVLASDGGDFDYNVDDVQAAFTAVGLGPDATGQPTGEPSVSPSMSPSVMPSKSSSPSEVPSLSPSAALGETGGGTLRQAAVLRALRVGLED